MVFLKELKLKNFKTFEGEHEIGPLMPVTAIVGSNGTGKSNLADAIAFVMGFPTSSLRAKTMDQLISRRNLSAYPDDTSVAAVLQESDGRETTFVRSIVRKTTFRYRVDDTTVSHEDYVKRLRGIFINPTARDFVVFQDSLESLLLKSPKELAAMFENISGSCELAAEYRRLDALKSQCLKDVEYLANDMKTISAEIGGMEVSKDNAAIYTDLEKELVTSRMDLKLFDLYWIEQNLKSSAVEIDAKSEEIGMIEKKKSELEDGLANAKRRYKQQVLKWDKLVEDIEEMETKTRESTQDFNDLQVVVDHCKTKFDSCRKAYDSAVESHRAREENVAKLSGVLRELENKRANFCTKVHQEEQILAVGERNESQEKEYDELKAVFLKTCAVDLEKLTKLEREYDSVRDKLDLATWKKVEAKDAVDQQIAFRSATKERVDNWSKQRDEATKELEKYQQLRLVDYEKFQALKERQQSVTQEIEKIDALDLEHDYAMNKTRIAAITERLMKSFPGVFGRLGNMCKPISSPYTLAVNTVLNEHVDSIVVDCSATASQCIAYLKAESLCVLKFLPLDSLEVEPLKKRARALKDLPNVKLHDHIKITLASISNAVLFVTGNTLVCETAEDAARISSRNKDGTKLYDCVSRDGIYYRGSGPFTKGSSQDTAKLRTFTQEELKALQTRKEILASELRAIQQDIPSTEIFSHADLMIQKTLKDIKRLEDDYSKTLRELNKVDEVTVEHENIFDVAQAEWEQIQGASRPLFEKIEAMKSHLQAEETRIFAGFCAKFPAGGGINVIQDYDNWDKNNQTILQELENEIDRLIQQLTCEKNRDTKSEVELCERNLATAASKLQSAVARKEAYAESFEYNDLMSKVEKLVTTQKRLEKSMECGKTEATTLGDSLREVSNKHQTCSKELDLLKKATLRLKQNRHNIVTETRIEGLEIPKIGNPSARASQNERSDSLSQSSQNGTPTGSFSGSVNDSTHTVRAIEIDFSSLPRKLLKLSSDEINKARKNLAAKVAEVSSNMKEIGAPNMRASEQLLPLLERKKRIGAEMKNARELLRQTIVEFDKIKETRKRRFMDLFERVESQVDIVYKTLMGTESVQACLLPKNPDEPYLESLHYYCIPPGKRFLAIEDLSGGEKALACLALLFTIHSSDSAPFQVFDEIDASLDSVNVNRVMKYINDKKDTQQTIIITHKPAMYAAADSVIRIAKQTIARGIKTSFFSINLQPYRDHRPHQQAREF